MDNKIVAVNRDKNCGLCVGRAYEVESVNVAEDAVYVTIFGNVFKLGKDGVNFDLYKSYDDNDYMVFKPSIKKEEVQPVEMGE